MQLCQVLAKLPVGAPTSNATASARALAVNDARGRIRSTLTSLCAHAGASMRPTRGFILPETIVLAGLGFQLFRVSAGGVIVTWVSASFEREIVESLDS